MLSDMFKEDVEETYMDIVSRMSDLDKGVISLSKVPGAIYKAYEINRLNGSEVLEVTAKLKKDGEYQLVSKRVDVPKGGILKSAKSVVKEMDKVTRPLIKQGFQFQKI